MRRLSPWGDGAAFMSASNPERTMIGTAYRPGLGSQVDLL